MNYQVRTPSERLIKRAVERATPGRVAERRSGTGVGVTHSPHHPGGGNVGDGDGWSVHALIWDFDSWDDLRSVWMEDA